MKIQGAHIRPSCLFIVLILTYQHSNIVMAVYGEDTCKVLGVAVVGGTALVIIRAMIIQALMHSIICLE